MLLGAGVFRYVEPLAFTIYGIPVWLMLYWFIDCNGWVAKFEIKLSSFRALLFYFRIEFWLRAVVIYF